MTRNFRRFAAAASLTLVLATTPAMAASTRGGNDRERTPVMRIVKQILKKFIGLVPMAEPSGPIPAPSTSNTNP